MVTNVMKKNIEAVKKTTKNVINRLLMTAGGFIEAEDEESENDENENENENENDEDEDD